MAPLRAAWAACLSAGFAAADLGIFSNPQAFQDFAEAADGFPSQTFRSSKLIAPVFQVNSWSDGEVDDSPYIFMGSVYGHMNGGPMIIDARDLSLVYADQEYENAYTSDVQTINGTRYMTYWEGYHSRGHANGFCLVRDENYNLVYNVSAQGLHGALADMHEMKLTEDATIIFTTYWNIAWNTTDLGGSDESLLMDSGFQEVDAATNEVLFDWAASKHFDVHDSFARYNSGFGVGDDSGFDFFHINSVDKTPDGNYLVSSRHLCMLTLIDGTDGHPIWILGGRQNQFKDLSDGRASDFGWQHDARWFHNQSQITMFDNHGEHTGSCEPDECHTRGLHIEIDTDDMTVRLVQEYWHPENMDAGAMGGFQQLKNGNVMTAWGHTPGFVEYTADGRPVMDVQRGLIGGASQNDMFAYRVSKHEWVGRPTWPPAIAMDSPNGTAANASIYVSWNGATDIAKWALFVADDPLEVGKPENLIETFNRTGFETTWLLGANYTQKYIAAAAVDADDNVIGSTLVHDMGTRHPVLLASNILSIAPPSTIRESHFDNIVMTAGGIVVFVAIFYGGFYFWRRHRASASDVEKTTQYERVETRED